MLVLAVVREQVEERYEISLSSSVLAPGFCSSCLISTLKLNLCNEIFAEQRFYLL